MVGQARELGAGREEALEVLCATYWQPVRQYLTGLGCPGSDAADVTQEFFASFLRGDGFTAADPAAGRLRTLLKQAAKNHLFSHWRRVMAAKRGGGAAPAPLEAAEHAAAHAQAEALYDRDWAVAVLDGALRRLEQSYEERGRGHVFQVIKTGLLRPGGMPDDQAAAVELGIAESQVRLAVFRARQRLHALLREEVALTVEAREVDDEVRYLLNVLLETV